DDFRLPRIEGEAPETYPITGFTYILVPHEMGDPAKAATLANFLWWGIHYGQSYAPGLHFGTLPPEVLSHGAPLARAPARCPRPRRGEAAFAARRGKAGAVGRRSLTPARGRGYEP